MRAVHYEELRFDKWLQDANIALALVLSLPIAIISHLALSAWVSATLIWYSIALVLVVIWSRRSLAGVLRRESGWIPVAATLAGTGTAILASRAFPIHYCLVPHCQDVAFVPSDIVGALLVAPAFETIVFQGWIQTISQRSGPLIAIAGTSVVFVMIHLAISPFSVVAALALSLLRFYTRSLLYVIIAHMGINTISTVLFFS